MQSFIDKFEITQIIHSYSVHLDIERVDVCTDLFLEDGKLELRIGKAKGKLEIEGLLARILEFTRGKRHFISALPFAFPIRNSNFPSSRKRSLQTSTRSMSKCTEYE